MSKMVSQAYQLHPVSLIYDVGQAKKSLHVMLLLTLCVLWGFLILTP